MWSEVYIIQDNNSPLSERVTMSLHLVVAGKSYLKKQWGTSQLPIAQF